MKKPRDQAALPWMPAVFILLSLGLAGVEVAFHVRQAAEPMHGPSECFGDALLVAIVLMILLAGIVLAIVFQRRLHRYRNEQRRAREALSESEERYRLLLQNANDAVYVHGVSSSRPGVFLEVNHQACKMLGYTREELLRMSVTEVDVPEQENRLPDIMRRLLETRRAVFRTEHRAKDGRHIPVEVSTRLFDLHGKPTVLSIVRDITERKRAEEDRLEMERRVLHAQKLESLGVLTGGIAHDFNNLLMAMLGNLDMALMELSPASPARPNIEQAVHAAKRAADLTRQMLAYAGKGRFMITDVDLSEMVSENAGMLRAAIPKTVTLKLHIASDLPSIRADAGQMEQIVLNLITNAAEAIGEKPGVVDLSTGVRCCDAAYLNRSRLPDKPAPGSFVWLEVADTGCGMDLDTQRRLFDPFFTTKFMGRGLGMSAVQGIVGRQKGAILVDSEPGQGTVVRILLPVTALACADATPSEKRLPEASLSGTLLVVDDEDMVRSLCRNMAERFGLTVLTAANGEEAVAVCRDRAAEIACVLLDLTMPKMDGLATFKALRSLGSAIPVILCSGYGEQDATQRFAGLGLAGFLQKPYSPEVLRVELARILGSV